jgi:hypothetical protein
MLKTKYTKLSWQISTSVRRGAAGEMLDRMESFRH